MKCMQLTRYVRRLRTLLQMAGVALLCSGCGWQLQGAHHVAANLQPLYLEFVDAHSEFSRALQQRLALAGVQLVDDASQAQVVLQVNRDNRGHRVISVSARNTPQEYEVFYDVEISLKEKSGAVLLLEPLAIAQALTYDETAALAKQREEQLLCETMAAELADQLLRQIRRL